jgi:hypothetical protein
MIISDVDREAFTLAIEMARNEDPGRRNQIDDFLRTRSFEEVGRFASYHCQTRALNLPPWQHPPCQIDVVDTEKIIAAGDDLHGKFVAAKLLRRMLELGLSKFCPDPMAAITTAEAKARPSAA